MTLRSIIHPVKELLVRFAIPRKCDPEEKVLHGGTRIDQYKAYLCITITDRK